MRKFLATVLVAMLATAGLAACGGDDDDDGGASSTEADASDDDGDDSAGDDDSGDDDSGDDDSDGAIDDYQALIEEAQSVRIRVTYEDSAGSQQILSQDGEGRSAFFTDGSVVISGPDGTVTCDGIDGDSPTCTQLPAGLGDLAGLGSSFLFVFSQAFAELGDVLEGIDESNEEIAGRDAICWNIDPSDFAAALDPDLEGEAGGRVCIDEETGILLEISSEEDDTANLIAVEVGEPQDSDFEPPVEPEESDIPGLDDLDIDLEELMEENS
jgi:hypothetical protein